MTATGKTQTGSPRALAAPEGVKRKVKRIPQLGSVPAKKCSLLAKKMKLTPLSLAAGVECPRERGAGLLAPNLASRTPTASGDSSALPQPPPAEATEAGSAHRMILSILCRVAELGCNTRRALTAILR